MRILSIILICVAICLASCGGKTEKNEEQSFDSAAVQKMRQEKKRTFQDSILAVTQADLIKTDSALQIVKAQHQQLEKKVTSQVTTKEEGRRLTALRLKRDSLQVRFDVLCAQVRLIHIKQKQD